MAPWKWSFHSARPPGGGLSFCRLALVCSLAALSGCAQLGGTSLAEWFRNGLKVGPNYQRPAAHVADQWIDAQDPHVVSRSVDHSHWWTALNDPTLDMLVQLAYQQNLPLRVAALRVMESRAQLGVARGSLFPQQQQAIGEYQRSQISRTTSTSRRFTDLPPDLGNIGIPRTTNLWNVGFDAAWELDIWGRFRRNIEAADASLNATVEDYDSVLVTLIGDVAATYVEYRTFETRLKFAQQNIEIQQGSLELAEVRFENGATTELDVQQARSTLANTEAALPALDARRRQAANRLCILLGMPPRDLANLLGDQAPIPEAPAEVVVGIPAELLRRRPDVRRAEREVAAQSARIGVAVADLYPAFNIVGSLTVQSADLRDLFQGSSVAGFLTGPGIRWNILNYGRIRNNIRVQDALFQQAVVNYENAVLLANQEVEDALIEFLRARQRFAALQRAVRATERSVELALTQYRDGAVDFNRVFSLQESLVIQQDNLANTQGDIAISLIRVYKALGGGWQIRLGPSRPVSLPPPEPVEELAPPANGRPAAPNRS
ncbi:MAG: efflux transporter outer membrane subunit [Planctomycetales bacterium]|nr:efflux transporter outer membrane subunit [Planctomycetales bacterium]NIM10104.1 efflux transporter outer membrane subunit [Planctomycetales bacterium]NIN09547.1 efflux transporter outer membrane subunit [Planctomycetales bacterium]NIN78658.1 efflux transporter outer membrane subunit [Planctomycetales bacterium]NIO35847.1 efflux transporter outer membrane subunit [Planctomycetales bacterium]